MDPVGGGGVDLQEPAVEFTGSGRGGLQSEVTAQIGIGGREIGQSVAKGTEIERGAPHKEDRAPSAADGMHRDRGRGQPPDDVERLGRSDNVEEVVGNALLLRGRGLGGADVESAVDRHRVDADNLGPKSFGEPHRQAGFPRRSRAGEKPAIGPQFRGRDGPSPRARRGLRRAC